MKDKSKFVGFEKHSYNPIIRPKTEALLLQFLQKKQPKQILEIGTYIGYSAFLMLENCQDATIVTLEKDPENASDAKENLKVFGARAEVVCCDAIDFLKRQDLGQFDFVFLDGAKGQYVKYLPYLKKILAKGGILFADDIKFYGKVSQEGKIAHKHRTIVNNLRLFLESLQQDKDFDTQIFDFEDGVSVSVKRC